MLDVIEQGLQHFSADLDIAHEAQHVLLDVGKLLDLPGNGIDLCVETTDLAIDGFKCRVAVGKARGQLLALPVQLLQPGLDLHRLNQDQLGFLAQVDRAALATHRVVAGFGFLHLLSKLRQLLLQEGE
ncbi:hypothetical protein D3C72_1370430 [compost metagenome]